MPEQTNSQHVLHSSAAQLEKLPIVIHINEKIAFGLQDMAFWQRMPPLPAAVRRTALLLLVHAQKPLRCCSNSVPPLLSSLLLAEPDDEWKASPADPVCCQWFTQKLRGMLTRTAVTALVDLGANVRGAVGDGRQDTGPAAGRAVWCAHRAWYQPSHARHLRCP